MPPPSRPFWSDRIREIFSQAQARVPIRKELFHAVPGPCSRPGACTCHHVYFSLARRGEHCKSCGCYLALEPTPVELLSSVSL